MFCTVQKWGNGLVIRIPKSIAEQLELCAGTPVELRSTDGVLTVRPKRQRKYTLTRLLKSAKGPSPHREMDCVYPVGRELL